MEEEAQQWHKKAVAKGHWKNLMNNPKFSLLTLFQKGKAVGGGVGGSLTHSNTSVGSVDNSGMIINATMPDPMDFGTLDQTQDMDDTSSLGNTPEVFSNNSSSSANSTKEKKEFLTHSHTLSETYLRPKIISVYDAVKATKEMNNKQQQNLSVSSNSNISSNNNSTKTTPELEKKSIETNTNQSNQSTTKSQIKRSFADVVDNMSQLNNIIKKQKKTNSGSDLESSNKNND